MSRRAFPIMLSSEEQSQLQAWAKARSQPHRLVQRAQIILLAAHGMESQQIARRLPVSRPTVQLWRQRFLALRTAGLEKDAPRPGRLPRIPADKIRAIVAATVRSKPPNATHWSTRTMARTQGVSEATVRRIWKQYHLKPHRIETFKLSRDPQFVEKLTDVVGLYLNPPEKALVLAVDEKSQIQALDRTQPGLPMKPGRCGTLTHDYKRHGTTTLFAALNLLDGAVLGDCMPQHRHQEFIRFLKRVDGQTPPGLNLHLIVDNYATHKHPRVKRWLATRPRFHVHFTPTYASWLNQVEIWFNLITRRAIRRGTFRSVKHLVATIDLFVRRYNAKAQPFIWTATADSILDKLRRLCERISGTQH